MDSKLKLISQIRIKNLFRALKQLLPLKRVYKLFFVTGNGWGLFSQYSHINSKTGKPKIEYPTLEKAQKAAESLSKKYGGDVSAYKCIYCNGYHIGNNR